MKWITYQQAPVDKLACAWLITRFIDPQAQFLFEMEEKMDERLKETGAIPFEIEGVEFASDSESSAFEKILFSYRFSNPALTHMGRLLRPGGIANLENALIQANRGDLIQNFAPPLTDDAQSFSRAIPLYDALYRWSRSLQNLPERWEPKTNAGKIF